MALGGISVVRAALDNKRENEFPSTFLRCQSNWSRLDYSVPASYPTLFSQLLPYSLPSTSLSTPFLVHTSSSLLRSRDGSCDDLWSETILHPSPPSSLALVHLAWTFGPCLCRWKWQFIAWQVGEPSACTMSIQYADFGYVAVGRRRAVE